MVRRVAKGSFISHGINIQTERTNGGVYFVSVNRIKRRRDTGPILGNFSLLVRSFVVIFGRRENFLDGPKIFQKLDRLDAVDFVKKSSKSEPSSRFLSRSKFENFACHFLANLADRPRICADLITIRSNPGTIG